MKEKVKRLYSVKDEVVILRAKVMHAHLLDGLDEFTAKFPWLDSSFAAEFAAAIAAANNFMGDTGVVNGKKVLTEDVQTAMTNADTALRALAVYAKLTYFNDPERRYVFGQKNWKAARNNRDKMFDALQQANLMAVTEPYKTDLETNGFTPAHAAQLLTLAAVLEDKKRPQGKAVKERVIKSADRIKLHNEVWKTMRRLSNCARLVYRDSYAHRGLFRLYAKREDKE